MKIRTADAAKPASAKPLTRGMSVKVRGIDVRKRTATFCATTENGVEIWDGYEWLRMSGVDLVRFQKNPVVLDAHNRWQSGCVIGRAPGPWIEGRRMMCKIKFAKTERANEIWKLVRDGFIKTLSIGYWPKEWKVLAEGQVDGEGEHQVKGPGVVVTKWELLEISTVPVPADPDALVEARSLFFDQEAHMAHTDKSKPSPISRAMTAAVGFPVEPEAAASSDGTTPEAAPAAPATGERAAAPPTPAAPAAPAKKPDSQVDEAERAARLSIAKRDKVLSFTPPYLKGFAEELILKEPELDTETLRKRLLDEHSRRNAPVGTPEPIAPKPEGEQGNPSEGAKGVADMTTDDFARAFKAS